ncbi:HelD family protein [Hamadaea tsunoensis]|uniref:HelD family protein n=1 Tax=Hamadaea tsunoensis TaxID=53368 RepID=UPI00041AD75A|nr:AAA family ATPase [Hamadaea tsunoensis]
MPNATEPTLDHELSAEIRHLTTSRAALQAMREHVQDLFATGAKVAGDPFSAETLGRTLAQRVRELADNPNTPLFFGKLTFAGDAADSESAGHAFHIGRRHVTDAVGEPLVLDWRAPVSTSFYRASAADPQDIAVRRRFGFHGGEITSFEDERLTRGEELGTKSAILTAEIERPRVGPMRDIVATIQPEQDELVRAALEESICVQGAPGTGKTAVGLHRAAYLLYLHRERLRRAGVLILGPNRAFLRYIAAVLPALGEVEVAQSTVDDLIARAPVRAADSPAAERLKHDARLAGVLHKLLWQRVTRPTESLVVPDDSYRWRIDAGVLARIVDDVRRAEPPYALGREHVRARVVDLLLRQSEARRGDSPGEAWRRRMTKIKPVTELIDGVWPAVTPEELLFELYSDPAAYFDEAEAALLAWPGKAPKTAKSARWTAADLVLLDEAAGLLERPAGFGHIVIDEAQDLSPMQARAVARRCVHGSVTLLGDLAQGTAPWAAADWRDVLGHLGKPDARVTPLTTGFRVPEQVVELANRLLPALEVAVPPARSLRPDGSLAILASAADTDLIAAVRAALAEPGSVGVICAAPAVERVTKALADFTPTTLEDDDPDSRLLVVPATAAKGLEYDHVVVVEPAEIVASEERGLHRLYVVLTRAVTSLTVLHDQPLPAALA